MLECVFAQGLTPLKTLCIIKKAISLSLIIKPPVCKSIQGVFKTALLVIFLYNHREQLLHPI